ncbi:MAG: hypothetical protein Q9M16_00260 [Mariprofundus sp.]|nr:hypothetical protein [Mariprofundus sp.]
MRIMALIAFVALQLTVYTCGFDIHVHAMESNVSHIAEHADDHNGQHNPNSAQHSCHLHASHTFTVSADKQATMTPFIAIENYHVLADLNLKKLPFRIEHPPKNLHS